MIRHLNRFAFVILAASGLAHAGPIVGVVGLVTLNNDNFYTSEYHSTTLQHYGPYGQFIDTLTLPTQYGSEVRGMAFRKDDGLLYAVMVNSTGFAVVAVDNAGTVHAAYQGASQIPDAGYDGKIAFSPDRSTFYVAAQNITAFTVGGPAQGRVMYSLNQVDFSDVATLPSGNLLIMGRGEPNNPYWGQSELEEITPNGGVMRMLPMNMYYVHAMAYDGKTNRYYVAGEGYQGSVYDLWAFDYSTLMPVMKGSAPRTTDIEFTNDGYTIVGSFSDGLRVYDANLNPVYQPYDFTGGSGDQRFVVRTVVPIGATSPCPPLPGPTPLGQATSSLQAPICILSSGPETAN